MSDLVFITGPSDSLAVARKACPVRVRGLIRSFGGSEGTRTPDPLHAMQVRYQLRHRPATPLGATGLGYYIPAEASRTSGRPSGMAGQSFQSRSSE